MIGEVVKMQVRLVDRFGRHGQCWVAFDANNDWRAFCNAEVAKSENEAIGKMFHADEIISVDGTTCVIGMG